MKEIARTVAKNRAALAVVMLYIVLLVWWTILHATRASSDALLLWGSVYQVVCWFGAVAGLVVSKRWGGMRSLVGRAAMAFSIGLLCQAFGQTAYALYVFYFHIEIPYPSIGDVGYFGSIPFYMYGAWALARVSGARVSLRAYHNQAIALFLPLILLLVSYLIFLNGYEFDWTQPLKVFLDFGYPLGQAVYVSIAILAFILSRKVLGGIMRPAMLFFIVALVAQYLCDFTFLYQAKIGTFYAGGPNDLMYATSYLFMSIALLYIGSMFEKIKNS